MTIFYENNYIFLFFINVIFKFLIFLDTDNLFIANNIMKRKTFFVENVHVLIVTIRFRGISSLSLEVKSSRAKKVHFCRYLITAVDFSFPLL